MLMPIDRIIISPPNGWKSHTFYICDVGFHPRKPTTRMILYSGEIRDDEPSSYNKFIHIGTEKLRFQDIHHIKALAELSFKVGIPHLILFWEDDEPNYCDLEESLL